MNKKYKDVIQWLENKALTEPEKAEQIINHNIDLVSSAFNKPFTYIHNLVSGEDLNEISPDDSKIVNFYFSTFRKWMR